MLAAAAAAVVVGLGAGAVFAQSGEVANSTSFLDRVAQKLGVDRTQLDQAIVEARNEELDQRLADGSLTQERADRLKERFDEVPDDGLFPLDPAPGEHASGFGFRLCGGHGCEFHSDELEGSGPLPKSAGFGLFEMHEKLADFLGIDQDALVEELQADGASLGSVAEAHGKSREELRDFLLAELRAGIDEAVAEGWLPEDRADSMYDRIPDHVDKFIAADVGMPRFPRFFEHGDEHKPTDQQQRSEMECIFSF